MTCNLLNARGYNGNKLKLNLKKEPPADLIPRTIPNSKERFDEIAKAKYQGQRWQATLGSHLATDEMFIGSTLKEKRQQKELVLKEKASRVAAEKLEGEALAIIESLGDEKKKLKVVELQKLLLFYGIERKKHAKGAVAMRDQYMALKEKNTPPKAYKKWTETDEAYLDFLKNETITIEETELGKERAKHRKKQKESLVALFKEVGREAVLDLINAVENGAACREPEDAKMVIADM